MPPTRSNTSSTTGTTPPPKVKLSPNDPHEVVDFQRHVSDDPSQAVPGKQGLRSWPTSVRSKRSAALVSVASAPPMRFSGGGYREAMKGDLKGWFGWTVRTASMQDAPTRRCSVRWRFLALRTVGSGEIAGHIWQFPVVAIQVPMQQLQRGCSVQMPGYCGCRSPAGEESENQEPNEDRIVGAIDAATDCSSRRLRFDAGEPLHCDGELLRVL